MKAILKFFDSIYQNRKLLLSALFLLALLGELVFLFVYGKVGPAQQQVPATDYLKVYEPVADNILTGKGIVLDGGLSIQSPPGYPVFLAGVFKIAQFGGWDRLGLITVFNLILTALGVCLLFLIAELVFEKRVALLASLLWMSYP
ncbi:MAG: glycosyltransferase family 39 protein, partial [Candidatus Nealsonbacteria bacterium]|nr:glycosyltransferase family 39 protein [Candidatus Nealsonbacteria bacterium]